MMPQFLVEKDTPTLYYRASLDDLNLVKLKLVVKYSYPNPKPETKPN